MTKTKQHPGIVHPSYPNRRADSDAVRQLLGLPPKAKLPDAGLPGQVIQGVTVWVAPAVNHMFRRGGGLHRVLCLCPDCGHAMSVGRLQQHRCAPGAFFYAHPALFAAAAYLWTEHGTGRLSELRSRFGAARWTGLVGQSHERVNVEKAEAELAQLRSDGRLNAFCCAPEEETEELKEESFHQADLAVEHLFESLFA